MNMKKGIIVLIVILIVVGAVVWFMRQSPSEAWTSFENQELGVMFEYKEKWGPIGDTQIVSTDSDLREFSFVGVDSIYVYGKDAEFYLNGAVEGEDGFLPNSLVGVNAQNTERFLPDTEAQKKSWIEKEYTISASGHCGYSTDVTLFKVIHYFAECITVNADIPNLVFSADTTKSSISAEEFGQMIESFATVQ